MIIHPTAALGAAALLVATGSVAIAQTPSKPTQTSTPSSTTVASAESTPVSAPAPGGAGESAAATGKLVLLFGPGSAGLGATNESKLDEAGRLYRSGKPIIMIVSGSSDTTGSPAGNLLLSQRRADAVAQGMAARGIPAERTQILAKGVTNLPVHTGPGVSEAANRRVEITWR